MHRLIPLLLLPSMAMAEGAVDRYTCEVVGCTGSACLSNGSTFAFTMTPNRIEADGTGSLIITFGTTDFVGSLVTPRGPLVWTEDDSTVAFLWLPQDRTVMTYQRYTAGADAPDATTTHYIACEVT